MLININNYYMRIKLIFEKVYTYFILKQLSNESFLDKIK